MSQTLISARIQPYRLPLVRDWVSAAGSLGVREGWLLRLETDAGLVGHGDCAPLWEAGTETPGEAGKALAVWCGRLVGHRLPAGLAAVASLVRSLMVRPLPSAHGAVEMALLDLASQEAGLPLAHYLAHYLADASLLEVPVNAALGPLAAASPGAVEAALSQGFSVLKFKVGLASPAEELARLRSLSLPEGVRVRLDANGAWDEATAAGFVTACAALPVESLEEPLARPTPGALSRLQERVPFPLALDESWGGWRPDELFAHPPVRRLVVKPQRVGGLLPALDIARQARSAGMEVVVTSSLESACGVLGAAHLAAALGGALAHGLATSSWLVEDTGEPPPIVAGRLRLPAGAGLGFSPRSGFS